MKHSSIYGAALIGGSLGAVVTMLFHPTGHDLLAQPDEIARRNELLTVAVHSLALMSFPLLVFGFSGFSRRIGWERPLVSAAFIAYAVACVGGMCAAVINGLVAPTITRQILTADEAAQQFWRIVLTNNGLLNHGFTKVFVVASSCAVIFWSICLLKKARLAQLIGVIGIIIGLIGLAGLLSGHLRLDVHGFGLLIFGQSFWTILLGVFLWQADDAPPS